jgi:curli biogenesis system outer membrane secretion channel CsgG
MYATMLRRWCSVALVCGFGVALLAPQGGCSSSGESAQADTVTKNVGRYSAPPPDIIKRRVGVPQFSVKGQGFGGNPHDLDELAADQMSSLLHQSRRFDVIERAQLEQLLKEQDMEGIVKPGELAKPGLVNGVDYLLLGKVTNFRIKAEDKSSAVGVGGAGGGFMKSITKSVGDVGYEKNDVKITTECGVDIRLVDPTSGKVAVAHFSEYKKTDTAGGMGFSLGGIKTKGDASIQITTDDAGKALRLALDDALKKMLPEIDEVLQQQGGTSQTNVGRSVTVGTPAPAHQQPPAAATPAAIVPPTASTPGDQQPAAAGAKKFCGECGAQVAAGAKFCPSCGAKAP